MNKYFVKAVERYKDKVKEEFKINPISQADSNILKEIREIFKKLNKRDIVAILDNYKYLADEEVEHSLLEYNTRFKEDKGEIEEEDIFDKKRKFLKIQDLTVESKHIINWNKSEVYNIEEEEWEYQLIINEVPEEATRVPYYANRVFPYFNEEERDGAYVRLEEFMLSQEDIDDEMEII